MISHKITLLTTLGIGTIGGIATGGYFLFKPETSKEVKEPPTTPENTNPNKNQNALGGDHPEAPDQNLRSGGASDSSGGLRDTQADTSEVQSLSSSSTVTPSQGSGAAADSSTQLPSR